jgi:hypothetical protein
MRTLENAKQYAAAVRERNKPDCDCETCRRERLLPIVMQIAANWQMRAKSVRRVK